MKSLPMTTKTLIALVLFCVMSGCSSKNDLRPYDLRLSQSIESYDLLLVKPSNRIEIATSINQTIKIPNKGMLTITRNSVDRDKTADHNAITHGNSDFYSSTLNFSKDVEKMFRKIFKEDTRVRRISVIDFDTLDNKVFDDFKNESKSDAILTVSIGHIYNPKSMAYGIGAEAKFFPVSTKARSLRKQPNEQDSLSSDNFIYRGVFNYQKNVKYMPDILQTLQEASENLPKSLLIDISQK